MLAVLSPSKTQNFSGTAPPGAVKKCTSPELLDDACLLMARLRRLSRPKLQQLLGVSANLTELNFDRIKAFSPPFKPENSRPALLAFEGDVYSGIEKERYSAADFVYAQKHLRILSGLYGVLRPLDLMQAYRLEMKTKLRNERGDSLYDFWREPITATLNDVLRDGDPLINLASQEYFKAIDTAVLGSPVVQVQFREERPDGSLRTVALFAKQARGLMADFIVRSRVKTPRGLRGFKRAGYRYAKDLSSEAELVFVRKQRAAA